MFMIKTVLSAGDIIEARCTRCRKVLNHRIVAMVDGKVARVECNTCLGLHNYHAPPAAKAAQVTAKSPVVKPSPVSGASRASRKDHTEAERDEWAVLCPEFDHDTALKYDMNGIYTVKRLVLHPVFGLGIVKSFSGANKMQVLFKDGIKLLRCQC